MKFYHFNRILDLDGSPLLSCPSFMSSETAITASQDFFNPYQRCDYSYILHLITSQSRWTWRWTFPDTKNTFCQCLPVRKVSSFCATGSSQFSSERLRPLDSRLFWALWPRSSLRGRHGPVNRLLFFVQAGFRPGFTPHRCTATALHALWCAELSRY